MSNLVAEIKEVCLPTYVIANKKSKGFELKVLISRTIGSSATYLSRYSQTSASHKRSVGQMVTSAIENRLDPV